MARPNNRGERRAYARRAKAPVSRLMRDIWRWDYYGDSPVYAHEVGKERAHAALAERRRLEALGMESSYLRVPAWVERTRKEEVVRMVERHGCFRGWSPRHGGTFRARVLREEVLKDLVRRETEDYLSVPVTTAVYTPEGKKIRVVQLPDHRDEMAELRAETLLSEDREILYDIYGDDPVMWRRVLRDEGWSPIQYSTEDARARDEVACKWSFACENIAGRVSRLQDTQEQLAAMKKAVDELSALIDEVEDYAGTS